MSALLSTPCSSCPIQNSHRKKKKQCYDTIVCLKKMVLSALFLYMLLTVSIAAFADGLKEFLPHFTTHVSLFTFV